MRHLYDSGASPFISPFQESAIYNLLSGGTHRHADATRAPTTPLAISQRHGYDAGMVPAVYALIAKEFTGAH